MAINIACIDKYIVTVAWSDCEESDAAPASRPARPLASAPARPSQATRPTFRPHRTVVDRVALFTPGVMDGHFFDELKSRPRKSGVPPIPHRKDLLSNLDVSRSLDVDVCRRYTPGLKMMERDKEGRSEWCEAFWQTLREHDKNLIVNANLITNDEAMSS